MRSELFQQARETRQPGMQLQNHKMLRVGLNGEFFARQGSMVAYQGNIDFSYQGAGSVGRFFKKAFTGEGLPLMRVSGQGDVFLARDAWDVHLIDLEEESLTVSGENVLAFEPTLEWDIRRVPGAGMTAGGLFNTVFTGPGRVAIACHGTPVLLDIDQPTFVDTDAAVAAYERGTLAHPTMAADDPFASALDEHVRAISEGASGGLSGGGGGCGCN